MPTRYLITLGAATTAGGRVTSASAPRTIDGVPVALAGDACWCPACDSEGVIGLQGPRLDVTVDGRAVALDGDLCLCGCQPAPRLLAAQDLKAQVIDA